MQKTPNWLSFSVLQIKLNLQILTLTMQNLNFKTAPNCANLSMDKEWKMQILQILYEIGRFHTYLLENWVEMRCFS